MIVLFFRRGRNVTYPLVCSITSFSVSSFRRGTTLCLGRLWRAFYRKEVLNRLVPFWQNKRAKGKWKLYAGVIVMVSAHHPVLLQLRCYYFTSECSVRATQCFVTISCSLNKCTTATELYMSFITYQNRLVACYLDISVGCLVFLLFVYFLCQHAWARM